MKRSIIICGLPNSGKTTFLAALWHLVSSRETKTLLSFHSMKDSDLSHLNTLVARWRRGHVQQHTPTGANPLITLNLQDNSGVPVRLTFPDLSGESYRRMWADRDCDRAIADLMSTGEGLLLFVNADKIKRARWIVEDIALSQQLDSLTSQPGLENAEEPEVTKENVEEWDPSSHTPTQVELVDILQMLRLPPLDVGPRRLVIMLSVWDKVEGEELSPEAFLAAKMPLLDQYLRYGLDEWSWKVYGVSAQGSDYESGEVKLTQEQMTKLEELRAKDLASTRIRLISDTGESNDLTEPITWLMS